MSFLSFFGSTFTTTHIIAQIYRKEEFLDFLRNITEASSVDVLHQFFRNLILMKLDPIILPILATTENQNIFKNKNLTRLEQSKILYGKIINHLLNNPDIYKLPTDPLNIPLQLVSSFIDGFITNLKEQKNEFIGAAITSLNTMPNIDTVKVPNDVYRIIIDEHSKIISGIVFSLIQPITNLPVNESALLNLTCRLFQKFNSIYEYQSSINKNDDSSSSSDTVPDEDEKDKEDEPPRKLKRGRAMKNLPKPDEDSKKPKN